MIKIFVDKNILFHYMRKLLFSEQVPLSSLQIVKCIHNKKIHAVISENAIFGVINYCIYKLERDYGYDQKDCEKRAKEKIIFMIKGDWEIKNLDIVDFHSVLSQEKVPFEDYCQYLCAKKAGIDLITHNVADFETVKDIKIKKPKEYIAQLLKKRIITADEISYQ